MSNDSELFHLAGYANLHEASPAPAPLCGRIRSLLLEAKQDDLLMLKPRSECFSSTQLSNVIESNDTTLLDLVRARQKEDEEDEVKTLDLPKDEPEDDEVASEPCVHGMGVRMTDRSISRSRVSRISTRRDMDIPSILAFTASCPTPPPAHLEIPAFGKLKTQSLVEAPPRWSIRRSLCPVCSQKWRDKSSVSVVKSSGLKRNSSMDLPSVIAPARLRISVTAGYVPRPALAAVDEDEGVSTGGLRNTSATWQLTRARKFRTPKPQMPPPEATLPPSSTAPLARKDLDQRVNKFLKDEFLKKPLIYAKPELQNTS